MSYVTRGLGLAPSQYPPVPSNMAFEVTESLPWFQTKSFAVDSAQALSDYVVFVNANLDHNVKTSQDGIYRAQSKGAIDSGLASQWIDFIANPSKYAAGSGTTPPPKAKTDVASIIEGGLLAAGIMFAAYLLAKRQGPKATASNPRKSGRR